MREIRNSVTKRIIGQLNNEAVERLLTNTHIAAHRGPQHVSTELAKLSEPEFLELRQLFSQQVEAAHILELKAALDVEAARLRSIAESCAEDKTKSLLEVDIPIALDLFERDKKAFSKIEAEINKTALEFPLLAGSEAKKITAQLRRYARQIAPEFSRKEVGVWVDEMRIVSVRTFDLAYGRYYRSFTRPVTEAMLAAE
jgi:hypothetical protein